MPFCPAHVVPEASFIGMEHVMLHKLLFEGIINRRKPVLGGADQPIGHGLAAQLNALPFPFLLLSVTKAHPVFSQWRQE